MSNLNEFIDGVSGSTASSVQIFGSAIGVVADFSGGIGVAVSAVERVASLISPSDSDQIMQNLLNQISVGFRNLEMELKAENFLAQMRDLDQVADNATAAYATLAALLAAQPPPTGAEVRAQLEKCIESLSGFRHLDKWSVVYADQGFINLPTRAYTGGGVSTGPFVFAPAGGTAVQCQGMTFTDAVSPAADATGLVFNYLYVLPAYMKTINQLHRRTTCQCGLAAADARHNTGGYRKPAAPRIRRHHTACRRSQSARERELARGYYPVGQGRPNPYGAVNTWSALSRIGSYPVLDLPAADDPEVIGVIGRFLLRSLARQKEVYGAIGLPVVRATIGRLRALVGDPPNNAIPFNTWSLREIYRTLGYPANPLLNAPDTFLERTAGRVLRYVKGTQPVVDAANVSLRAALAETPPDLPWTGEGP